MIGLNVSEPKKECSDQKCPFHGHLKVRGRVLSGKIVKIKQRSGIMLLERYHSVPKYERYERRNTRITVHVPECLEIKEGDEVTVAECRPISKTKSFVVVEKKE